MGEPANYEPVRKMAGKAAQLREELEVLGSSSAVSRRPSTATAGQQPKRSMPRALSVRISEPGLTHAHSSPAVPALKHKRPSTAHHTSQHHQRPSHSRRSAFASVQAPLSQQQHQQDGGLHHLSYQATALEPSPSCSPARSPSRTRARDAQLSPTNSYSSSHNSNRGSNSPSRRNSFHGTHKGGPVRMSLAMQELNQTLSSRVHDLESTVRTLKASDEEAREELERRQSSYMRREEQLNAEVADLKVQLARAQGERNRDTEPRFGKATQSIQELHGEVVGEIDNLLAKQAMQLKHEEAATLRRFKQKLADAEVELTELRGVCGKADSVWIERTKQLRAELESVQEIAVKLDKMYKLSEEENGRLRAQFKCQEDDREYLIRQVVTLKKDNKKLASELATMASDAKAASQERDDLIASQTADHIPLQEHGGSRPSSAPLSAADRDTLQARTQRYESIIDSLKRLLESERRRTKQARAAHTAELMSRTELQGILRQCVEDVRMRHQAAKEGSLRSAARASPSGPEPGPPEPPGVPDSPRSVYSSGGSSQASVSTAQGVLMGTSGRPGGARPRPFSAAPTTTALTAGGQRQLGRPSSQKELGGDLSGAIVGTGLGPSHTQSGGGEEAGQQQEQQQQQQQQQRVEVGGTQSAPGGAQASADAASASPFAASSAGSSAAEGVHAGGAAGLGRSRRPPLSRPLSAMPRMQAQRPMSGVRRGSLVDGGVGAGVRDGILGGVSVSEKGGAALGPEEREQLVQVLTQKEEILKLLFDRAFPGGPALPTMPGDTARLDRMAAARDARDATVVANARALALSSAANGRTPMAAASGGAAGGAGPSQVAPPATGGSRPLPASVAQDATPGSDLQKEAAARPWVFSVDAMIQDFLSNRS